MKTKILLFMILCLSSLCVMGFTDNPPKGKVQGTIDRNSTRKPEPKKQQTTAPAKPKPATPAAKPQQKQTPKPEPKPKPQQPKVNQHPSTPKPTAIRVSYDSSSNSLVFGNNRYKMVYVSGGSFNMGATSEQVSDALDNEKPAHRVIVSEYYIGQTEVTQALWQAVMGTNPSNCKGDNLPVERVSWNDCLSFIEKLNAKTGRTFRLPTEAEWEFAARGGNNSRGYKYSGSNYLDDVAWYDSNSNNQTHTVATKQANELGIYDMNGNVWEWCSDWYDSNYYKNSDSNNPRGAYTGSTRVDRGGGWDNDARLCRVSFRDYSTPDIRVSFLGLRLVLRP